MKNSEVVIGVLSGLAVGAVLGVLFAPDKGSNTRKKISEKGTDLKDTILGNINDFVSSIENQYSNFASNAEDAIEDGKSKIDEMSNKISR
jgi:gas vesicle protein